MRPLLALLLVALLFSAVALIALVDAATALFSHSPRPADFLDHDPL